MLQKIIQVGNSYAIIIPRSVMEEVGITVGNKMKLITSKKPAKIEIIPVKEKSTTDIIDQEVYHVAKNLLKRYLPAFKELANK